MCMAQSPKHLFKSLAANNILKSTARFEKISNKSRNKMPEMYYLAEAALLNMPEQMGANKLHGYEILSAHIDNIRSSKNSEEVFGGLEITLEEVIANIEQQSFDYLMAQGTERNFVLYITWAQRGNHPCLSQIESRLELLRYNHIIASKSIEECDFFLTNYPESEYRDLIAEHRTTLLYEEAVASDDEEQIERFIENYGGYSGIDSAKEYLMSLRYNRIFGSETSTIEDKKWFLAKYPQHAEHNILMQAMANEEFESLPATSEALEEFIEYYGDVSQRAEAQRRLHLARIAESGSIRDFVDYIKHYGYDTNYSMMIRHIYHHSKRYIITPDISDVTLLRYAAEDGLTGYMDFDGNMVIEPIYDARQVSFGVAHYNNAMLSEFTTQRNYVALSLNGSWGVINNKGQDLVQHKYQAITIYNNQIYAVPDITAGEADERGYEVYICDVYNSDGEFIKSGETTEWNGQLPYRAFVGDNGLHHEGYITPKYYLDVNNNAPQIVDIEGNSYATEWNIINGVTDNIAVVEATGDDEIKRRYFANLDTRELIKECPYSVVHPMSCGLAAVYIDDKGYGFIDEDLELKISAQFGIEFATMFNCGLMVVRNTEGIYGIINTHGEYVLTTNSTISDMRVGCCDQFLQPGLFLISDDHTHTLVDSYGITVATISSTSRPNVRGIYLMGDNRERVKFNLALH